MTQDRPTASELLEAVREFLTREVQPRLDGQPEQPLEPAALLPVRRLGLRGGADIEGRSHPAEHAAGRGPVGRVSSRVRAADRAP